MDINKIKEAEPKEAILSGLVESGSLNVLIAPDCGTPGFFRSCVRAIALYMKNINGSLRAALFCDGEPDENDRKKTDLILKGYGLRGNVTRVDFSETDTALSWILGADVFLMPEKPVMPELKADCIRLAKEFALPVISLGGAEDLSVSEGVLHVDDTPYAAAAALAVVKGRHYRALLEGEEMTAGKGDS